MKTAIYLRVSSQEQSKFGFSMDNQKERCINHCNYKGLDNIIVIEDDGISGKNISKRPGFIQLINMVKNKEVCNVVCFSISRIGRNALDTLTFYELLKKNKTTLYSVSEGADGSTAYGRKTLRDIASQAQFEVELLGERVSSVLQHKKSKGKTYSQAPFGLQIEGRELNQDGNVVNEGNLAPHPKEAPIVQIIFSRNTYPSEIQAFLNNNSIKPKKADKWSRQAIVDILNNKELYRKTNVIV